MRKKQPRSYSDFTLENLESMFGIENRLTNLMLAQQEVPPSEFLIETLRRNQVIPLSNEKAKSEVLIVPILVEIINNNPNKLQCFSGKTFDVEPEQALKGRCDFLFTKEFSVNINAPVVTIFEAKDDVTEHWFGQCGAEMYAAKLFNQRKNEPYQTIYGAITNGREWVFLKLEENILLIDTNRYSLKDLAELLGALQTIFDFYD